MKKILPAVFLIVGSIIGAGFASGRELSLFFAKFGYNSLYFLPIVFILFYYCFKFFLGLGSKEKFENIFAINKLSNSSPFFNIAIIAIFFVYSSAMFAGAVEVLKNNFIEINSLVFTIFVFLLAFLVLKFGLKGLVRINYFLIPIIVILLVIYSIYSTIHPITNIAYIPETKEAYVLPLSIIIYVFGNILLSYFILTEAGKELTSKEITKASFLSALIICFVLFICIMCLITNGTVVMDARMPFIVLTLRLGEPFPIIFMLILFLGIITSLFGCLHTVSKPFQPKLKGLTSFIVCLTVLLISLLGFENIVNYCYPVVGAFGLYIVVKLIIFQHQKDKMAHKN